MSRIPRLEPWFMGLQWSCVIQNGKSGCMVKVTVYGDTMLTCVKNRLTSTDPINLRFSWNCVLQNTTARCIIKKTLHRAMLCWITMELCDSKWQSWMQAQDYHTWSHDWPSVNTRRIGTDPMNFRMFMELCASNWQYSLLHQGYQAWRHGLWNMNGVSDSKLQWWMNCQGYLAWCHDWYLCEWQTE